MHFVLKIGLADFFFFKKKLIICSDSWLFQMNFMSFMTYDYNISDSISISKRANQSPTSGGHIENGLPRNHMLNRSLFAATHSSKPVEGVPV